jgi:hypothetical protein
MSEIEELKQRITELEAQSQWVSVDEPPKINSECLVGYWFRDTWIWVEGEYTADGGFVETESRPYDTTPKFTHYQLVTPPAKEQV